MPNVVEMAMPIRLAFLCVLQLILSMRVLILRGLMIAMLTLVVSSGVAFADPLEDAQAAYNRGDYANALRLYKPLAEHGNADAQNDLGAMYANGQGVPKDDKEAVKWYRLSAEQGEVFAQQNLGFMYQQGRGVPQNYAEAAKWFRKAADQGDVKAQYNLGCFYRDGEGVPQNDAEASKWFRKAADQGLPEAQYNLAFRYDKGLGVPQDYAEAAKWYRKSAEQGVGSAQFNLGLMYYNGQGVPQDYVQAYIWFNLSASNGNTDASHNRDVIARYMTPAQIAEAQRLTRAFVPIIAPSTASKGDQFDTSTTSVLMQEVGGVYVVPVLINDAIPLNFVVDSGAADVSIPADVVMTLMRTGTLKESDYLGEKTYVLGDGSTFPAQTFRIRSLKVGNKVLENVIGSVASVKGGLLLGQSFLSRFKSWSIDNNKHALLLSE